MKLLLYCTKAKPYLADFKGDYQTYSNGKELDELFDKGFNPNDIMNILNGKIVAECDFEVEEIGLVEIPDYAGSECYTFVCDVDINFETKTLNQDKLFKKSCLNWEEMEKYFGKLNYVGKKGYAIHIKNLNIFDKPKYLSDYNNKQGYRIYTSPQNMCYAYDNIQLINKFIIISIKPEWLCKILNGEKTIDVRKRVLKEMLK